MPIARPGETGSIADPSEKRSRGEDRVPAPGHNRDSVPDDVTTIRGWGVDLEFERRNVFPMELPSNVKTARGNVKHWQVARTTVDISNEHAGLTPVFGDTLPPRGLSGLIRNYAYEYGEATTRHWMGLMFADRVDRLERLIGDALAGHPDNVFAERALGTKVRHRQVRPAGPLLVFMSAAAVAAGLALLVRRR
jgi:hypothetical protein